MELIFRNILSLPWAYVLPILISVFLIRLFYRAFKNTWPELYFSVSDYTSLFISFSPVRYFAFTLLPTMVISAFVLSLFLRGYHIQNVEFLGLIIATIHSLSTNGVALWKLLTNNRTVQTFYNKYFQMFVHVLSIFTISATGYIGGILGKQGFLIPLIPTWGVIDNLWAALFSSMLTIYLYKIYTNKYTSEEVVIEKSKKSLSAKLIQHINTTCDKLQAKRELVMAVCITENIQRPSWVRSLEKIKSYVFKSGTYGIMQIQSDTYLDDFKSVDIAIEKYFKNTASVISLTDDEVKTLLSNYNRDSKFIEFAVAAFYDLQPKG